MLLSAVIKEKLTAMESQIKNLLSIASQLIEDGKSTIDTAFVDAIELQNRHSYGAINAIAESNRPSRKQLTGYDEVYDGLLKRMSKVAYAKIKNNK